MAKWTQSEIDNVIGGRYHSFIQDVVDTGTAEAILANTETKITIDAVNRNFIIAPDYMTDRWDTTDNKMTFVTEMNTPTYVADLGFTFTPTVGASGTCTVKVYIDDPTTPKLIRTVTHTYKSSPERFNSILTWYLGSGAGYDAKNDGIYFTMEFTGAGSVTDKSVVIYHT